MELVPYPRGDTLPAQANANLGQEFWTATDNGYKNLFTRENNRYDPTTDTFTFQFPDTTNGANRLHQNRKPVWWNGTLKFGPAVTRILLCLYNVIDLHEADTQVDEQFTRWIKYLCPYAGRVPTAAEKKLRDQANTLHGKHKNWDPLDLALYLCIDIITGRDSGRPAQSPSAGNPTIIDGKVLDVADYPLRVS